MITYMHINVEKTRNKLDNLKRNLSWNPTMDPFCVSVVWMCSQPNNRSKSCSKATLYTSFIVCFLEIFYSGLEQRFSRLSDGLSTLFFGLWQLFCPFSVRSLYPTIFMWEECGLFLLLKPINTDLWIFQTEKKRYPSQGINQCCVYT